MNSRWTLTMLLDFERSYRTEDYVFHRDAAGREDQPQVDHGPSAFLDYAR
jgi:hypothetical protein